MARVGRALPLHSAPEAVPAVPLPASAPPKVGSCPLVTRRITFTAHPPRHPADLNPQPCVSMGTKWNLGLHSVGLPSSHSLPSPGSTHHPTHHFSGSLKPEPPHAGVNNKAQDCRYRTGSLCSRCDEIPPKHRCPTPELGKNLEHVESMQEAHPAPAFPRPHSQPCASPAPWVSFPL